MGNKLIKCWDEFNTYSSQAHIRYQQPYALNQRRAKAFSSGQFCAKIALEKLGVYHYALHRDHDGVPIWPKGYQGSISHSDGYAWCVIQEDPQEDCAIGIDLQVTLNHLARAERLAHKIGKNDPYLSSTQPDNDLLICQKVTQCFSAKEALYKALYPSIRAYFGFDAALMMDQNTLMLTKNLGPWPKNHIFEIKNQCCANYTLTLICTKKPEDR